MKALVTAVVAIALGFSPVATGIAGPPPPARSAADAPRVIRSGPRGCREVAITFDLCPVRRGSGFDEGLVDELVREHISATFFLSGSWIVAHDAEVRRLLAVSFFEIETHGQLHAHLRKLDREQQREEIEGPAELLRARYDYSPSFFRPPYGEYDDTTLDVARNLGLRPVLWSSLSGDPDPLLSESDIVKTLSDTIRDGSVVLFHANGKGRYTQAVVQDLEDGLLRRKHLRSVTLAELMSGCGDGSSR